MGDKSAYMAHEGSTAYRTSVIFWNRIFLLRLCHTMGWTRDSDLWKKKQLDLDSDLDSAVAGLVTSLFTTNLHDITRDVMQVSWRECRIYIL